MAIDLFKPYKIGKLELRNRFVRSATVVAKANESGAVTDDAVALYKSLGEGGVGLIVTGATFVSPLGQIAVGQDGIHSDAMIPGLHRVVTAAHQGGARIALQLFHGGINAAYLYRRGQTVLAVSRMANKNRPHWEITEEDIEAILADFVAAALRAKEAGFDAVQFHGAHGYLLSQFLSPLYNFRTDSWGGSAVNRRRFVLELIGRVRRVVGADFPLFIKLGVQDDVAGGLSLAEGLETARQLVGAGIDTIEVSVGFGEAMLLRQPGEPERAYFRERAAAVRGVVAVPVIAIGGIRRLETAQSIVDSGEADMIALSRPLVQEPGLIARWQGGDSEPSGCISCNKCMVIEGEVRCWL